MPASDQAMAPHAAAGRVAHAWLTDAAGFLRGTRILTESGELPVEDLLPGMIAVTAGGGRRQIVQVGQLRVHLARHPHPNAARPVRVRRGALGNGVPSRDLIVSPDHGFLLNTVLIPARALVNGATIVPESQWQGIHYYTVALDAHDVLLADSAPAESLPQALTAAGNVVALHPTFPDHAPTPWDCARRAMRGPAVQDARRLLLSRARILGHALTSEPDLHVLVDGTRMNPSGIAGPLHRFAIQAGARDVRVVSRAGVPAETNPASEDRRRLGVMLARIVLRAHDAAIDLPASDPALAEGFHPLERTAGASWRWTDGHARLPFVPPGLTRIDLHVLGAQQAWARAAPPGAPAQRGG